MSNADYSDLEYIPGEDRYVEFDDDFQMYFVLGQASNFCYSQHFDKEEAEDAIKEAIRLQKLGEKLITEIINEDKGFNPTISAPVNMEDALDMGRYGPVECRAGAIRLFKYLKSRFNSYNEENDNPFPVVRL